MKWILPLAILIVFEGLADYFAGKFGENNKIIFGIISFTGYAIANLSWLIAVKNGSGLARGAVIFAVASALLAVLIGVLIFKENLGKVQLIGVGLGIVSLALIFSKGNI
jgi:glucose uptake protein GlcU